MKQKIAIWGAAGHALVVADIIRLMGEYEIVGFVDDFNPVQSNRFFCSARVFGGVDCADELKQNGVTHLIFGFGNCKARLRLTEWSRGKGFSLATAIHPKATVAEGASIGQGSVIAAGAVVNPGVTLGENVIINTCASVDHECVIGDGVHICPGAHLAGKVSVGQASWVGIGVTVIDRISIGSGVMIGAGAVVVNDIPDGMLAYGVPAKIIKRI